MSHTLKSAKRERGVSGGGNELELKLVSNCMKKESGRRGRWTWSLKEKALYKREILIVLS